MSKYTAGTITVKPFGKQGEPGYLSLELPNNKYNAVELIGDAPIAASTEKSPLYGGFWARGKGTVRIRTVEAQGKGYKQLFSELFLITSQWQYYRTSPLELTEKARFAISVFGAVDIAFPEVAPLPDVDSSAEMVFYAPCDNGTPEALFSTGSAAFDGMPFFPSVPGICGNAIRIDRKCRLAPDGQLIYPLGFSYDFRGCPLDKNRGTVEFWFRPLPEMLEKQHWEGFPLFILGDTTWQWANSQDFNASISQKDGKLVLTLNEYVRVMDWPSGTRRKNPEASGFYTIEEPEAFVNQWHHVALTYDETQRVLYLDGQPRISFAALKKPAISSRIPKLAFTNGTLSHPAVITSDLDEIRIYRGVRYHGAFVPQKKSAEFQMVEEDTLSANNVLWTVAAPVLSEDKQQIQFALTRGKEKSLLAIAVGDGDSMIFSGRDALVGIRCDHAAPLENMAFDDMKTTGDTTACTLKNGDVDFSARIEKQNGCVRLVLTFKKNHGQWRAFLEPRISVINGGIPWKRCYDGMSAREILFPFTPFACRGLLSALPAVCAWNGQQGTALMLAPETLCGYLERGMTAPNEIALTARSVLDMGDELTLAFDIFPFDATYGENAAIDRYHELHPAFYRFDRNVNPKIYTGYIFFNVWNNAAYEKRKADFSYSELARRTGSFWAWFYYNAPSPGNWSTNAELLSKLEYINLPRVGNDVYHKNFIEARNQEQKELKEKGIASALYFYNWADSRYARYFSDSCMDARDTYSGIASWPQYWGRHAIDVPMMPSGTRYGQWLRQQLSEMMANYPHCDMFAYDLCGYWYTFRKPTTLGGLRAFDEDGVYAENVTAIALLLDEFRQKKSATGYRPGFVANADIGYTGFQSIARVESCIHEQQSLLTLQFRQGRQRQTRLMGEKPTAYGMMPPLNGNFFDDEDPRLLRYAAVALHHYHLLCGMLWNIRPDCEIAGVRETMEALDELCRIQKLGYRQTTGLTTPETLLGVRYGEIRRGAMPIVNMGPFPQKEKIAFNAGFFKETPLMGIAGRTTTVRDCEVLVEVEPLSWSALESFASIPGNVALEYTSEVKRLPGHLLFNVTFASDASLRGLRVRILENERCTLRFNGKKVAPADLDKVSPGDQMQLEFSDIRYSSSAEALAKLPVWEKDNGCLRISCDDFPEARSAAMRIAEFFNFVASNHHWKAQTKIVKADEPADISVRIIEGRNQMSSGKAGIVLQSTAAQMSSLTEEYLRILDKKYPWYGPFGTQMPTKFLDYAATVEQKRFLERGGLINGNPASVVQSAENFRNFLKEKQVDVRGGF
ncbi:MAG: LamG domain-containing protein [Oligosphaeraceae bacterium]|nr:LamG domain-containing protein [Oligosphaeraceae bacterium]